MSEKRAAWPLMVRGGVAHPKGPLGIHVDRAQLSRGSTWPRGGRGLPLGYRQILESDTDRPRLLKSDRGTVKNITGSL